MLWFRSHLATVVAVGLLRAVDAQGRGCADLGALIPVEWPAYDPEVMGLLPQGRTYCDKQTTGDFYCDECPESCLTLEATIHVVKKQLEQIASQTNTWDILENDIDSGCALLQKTCNDGNVPGGAWSTPVYTPYPTGAVWQDQTLSNSEGTGPLIAGDQQGVINWGPEVVGSMTCGDEAHQIDGTPWTSLPVLNGGPPQTCSYCSYCSSIGWGADTGRRMLGDPYPAAAGVQKVTLVIDSATVLGLGYNLASLDDCEVTVDEMSRSARFLAKATQRHHRDQVAAFSIPGCSVSGGSISQALDGERKVTLTKKTWNSLGPVVDGIMTVRSATKVGDAMRLADDFRAAGCGQFQLKGTVCEELEVIAFEVVSTTPIDVTVRAIFRLSGGQHLVEARMGATN